MRPPPRVDAALPPPRRAPGQLQPAGPSGATETPLAQSNRRGCRAGRVDRGPQARQPQQHRDRQGARAGAPAPPGPTEAAGTPRRACTGQHPDSSQHLGRMNSTARRGCRRRAGSCRLRLVADIPGKVQPALCKQALAPRLRPSFSWPPPGDPRATFCPHSTGHRFLQPCPGPERRAAAGSRAPGGCGLHARGAPSWQRWGAGQGDQGRGQASLPRPSTPAAAPRPLQPRGERAAEGCCSRAERRSRQTPRDRSTGPQPHWPGSCQHAPLLRAWGSGVLCLLYHPAAAPRVAPIPSLADREAALPCSHLGLEGGQAAGAGGSHQPRPDRGRPPDPAAGAGGSPCIPRRQWSRGCTSLGGSYFTLMALPSPSHPSPALFPARAARCPPAPPATARDDEPAPWHGTQPSTGQGRPHTRHPSPGAGPFPKNGETPGRDPCPLPGCPETPPGPAPGGLFSVSCRITPGQGRAAPACPGARGTGSRALPHLWGWGGYASDRDGAQHNGAGGVGRRGSHHADEGHLLLPLQSRAPALQAALPHLRGKSREEPSWGTAPPLRPDHHPHRRRRAMPGSRCTAHWHGLQSSQPGRGPSGTRGADATAPQPDTAGSAPAPAPPAGTSKGHKEGRAAPCQGVRPGRTGERWRLHPGQQGGDGALHPNALQCNPRRWGQPRPGPG